MGETLCHCGQPLHYTDKELREMVEKLIERNGEFLRVTTRQGTWLVQRHYIALHGLKSEEIPNLGFKKVE